MTIIELGAKRKPREETDRAMFERGDHVEIAERLCAQLRIEGPVVHDEGFTYQYSQKSHIFEPVPQARMSQIVQKFAGAKIKGAKRPLSLRASDVGGVIKLAQDILSQPGFFTGAPRGISFEDCFIEVSAEAITKREHAAENRARFAYPFGFVDAPHPTRWLAFWAQVFMGDPDASQKVRCVQQYVGASLLGLATRYQRALVNDGAGANGKSVGTTVIERAMPPGACSAIPPQDWGNEYRLAMLAGRLLNIVSELPEADIIDSEAFKAVVTGDSKTGRHIRQAPFTFRPVAGHIFSANRLPGTADQSHGFWRRFIVIKFNRVFAEHEQDPTLAEQIVQSELPAIVSWFVLGAQEAMQLGGYTVPESSASAIADWKRNADQIRAFVDDWTTTLKATDNELGTPAERLYGAYRNWSGINGHRPVASNTFGQRMKQLGLPSKHTGLGNVYPVKLEKWQ